MLHHRLYLRTYLATKEDGSIYLFVEKEIANNIILYDYSVHEALHKEEKCSMCFEGL